MATIRSWKRDKRGITGLAEARMLIMCACLVGFFVFFISIAPIQLIDSSQLNQAGLVTQPTYASQSGLVFAATFNDTLGDTGSQNDAGIKLGAWIVGITAFGPVNGAAGAKGNLFLVQSNVYYLGFINAPQYQTGTTFIFQGRSRCNNLVTSFPGIGTISCALNSTLLDADAATLGIGANHPGILSYQVQTPDTSFWMLFYWNQTAYATPTLAWKACTVLPCTGGKGLFFTLGADFNQARSPNFAADALIRLATLSAPTPNVFLNVLIGLPFYIGVAFLIFKFITAVIPTLNS